MQHIVREAHYCFVLSNILCGPRRRLCLALNNESENRERVEFKLA